jgi:uncharacterized membrane protein YphA (DoxX/SURF4 family)
MDFREYRSGHFGFRAWGLITLYLRLALGIGYLSAVADRLGWWGPPGTPQVAWGNFQNFLLYTAKLNPWFPHNWIPAVGVIVNACEICFGLALIVGYRTRWAAVLSGLLTLAFAIGMVCGSGIQAPLNYSVFAVSAGSFLLADAQRYPVSLDNYRGTKPAAPSGNGKEHDMAAGLQGR